MTIGIIGLGFVGLTFAVAAAKQAFMYIVILFHTID